MLVLQCVPPVALVLPYLPVWQRMSWIFILVALAAAAILMAAIWCEGGAVKGGEEGGWGAAEIFSRYPTHLPRLAVCWAASWVSPAPTYPPFCHMLSCFSVCC